MRSSRFLPKFAPKLSLKNLVWFAGLSLVWLFMTFSFVRDFDEDDVKVRQQSLSSSHGNSLKVIKPDSASFQTMHRCVGARHGPKSWKQSTCYFRNICYDPSDQKWIYIDSTNSPPDTFEMEVSLSVLSRYWKDQDKVPGIPWKPTIARTPPQNASFYSNLHILYSSYNAESIGLFILDELLPLYRSMKLFDEVGDNVQPLLHAPDPPRKWTCDDMIKENYHDKWVENCKMNYQKLPSLFTKSGRFSHERDFTQPVCFAKLIAGMGMLGDHCEDETNHGRTTDIYQSCNVGQAEVFWEFRNFLMRNIDLDPFHTSADGTQVLLHRREDESVLNMQQLVKSIKSLGVTIKVVSDGSKLTLREQIALMSHTSIFITQCIGAATAVSLFLPRGATYISICKSDKGHMDYQILRQISHFETIWITEPDNGMVDVQKVSNTVKRATQAFGLFRGSKGDSSNMLDFRKSFQDEKKEKKPKSSHAKTGSDMTIYVSIASFRDARCHEMVISAYGQAEFPERVYFGIFQQHFDDKDIDCLDFSKICADTTSHPVCDRSDQIRIRRVQANKAQGPTWGRHFAETLLEDEDFALQIDSHSVFVENWDSTAINMWMACQNEYAVISSYPNPIGSQGRSSISRERVCAICHTNFGKAPNDMIRHSAARCMPMPEKNYGRPLPVPFWGAGLSFSKAHRVRTVPYDEYTPMLFSGEEWTMGVRMWTAGYDIYAPNRDIIFHYYPGKKEKRPHYLFDTEKDDKYELREQGAERIKCILGLPCNKDLAILTDIEKYQLGTVRSLQQYLDLVGVDLINMTTTDLCVATFAGDFPIIPR